eukprot:CAMPEP_0117435464 /NCGR_PEP_ID=MMETSP0759-20121206/496_1 /TAXON_ID=63605 /ORGANISM="Percolomonas cosmopolitus, Strain WS" /LENGTH=3296 /DNA_ID=CAMNT_0005227015 /DNA_START=313 /DNA_END=10203 /DNA_ORIENTATION=-
MQYTQQISRSKPQLIEDAKLWEKYAHYIIRSKYDLMTIDEEEEPLYTYLVKAQKLQDLYEAYHSSNDPTVDQDLLESLVDADSDDRVAQLRQLTFPFDQVSEGYFLAYFLEVIGDLQKGIYSHRLKKDVSYRIQYVKNLEFLLNVIHNDFKLDLMKHGVEAEALAKNNYEAVNNMFWLLFAKLKLDKVLHNGARGEEGLLQWACDCVSYYPGIDMADMQFEDGFSDGSAFCYIYHFYNAESIELHRVLKEQPDENLKQAFEAGWKYCNIPHIIQNHNINKRSAILYLHMMYEALHTKDRSTFDTNQISRIIRRKLEFEKLKNFYSDSARTLLDDLRGMEQDIQDIRPNQYLPQVRIDDLRKQFLNDYKSDKANFLGDFLKIHTHHFHMECFLTAENGFAPFDPPKQLTIRHLYEIYDSLTPMEQRYMNIFHNVVAIHAVVSDSLEDYTHTMDAIKAFTEDVTDKIVHLELGTELESFQHVHSQVGDILTDIGQHRALLRIIRHVDAHLKSHQIVQKPLLEDLESMWDSTHQQTSDLLAKVEREMTNQIDAEVLKLEYSFMTDAVALSIANSLLSLQAPYVGPKVMRKLFFAVDNFVVEKTKRLQDFSDTEQKLVVLGQDLDITREHLTSFLQDLLQLKKIKESDLQELLQSHEVREKTENAANQLSAYMLDFANFLEKASERAVGQKFEPEEHISRNIDTFKSFEKEKGHFSNLLTNFLDLYAQYATDNRFVDIKFSDQGIQSRWNRIFEVAEAQKEWMYQRLEKHEQIPNLRLSQQAETQKMLQFLNHQKRDNSITTSPSNSDRKITSENALRLHEENVVSKCAEMRQIVSRHIKITEPGVVSDPVRELTVTTFSNICDSFTLYVNNVLNRWNQYTLNAASISEINKQRIARLQRQLTHSIQNSTMRIPSLKAVEEVLREAKAYSHEYIILDQIEFIDEILSKTDPSESRERTQQIEILQNQWKRLWDLIRGQVRKLVEGEGNIISPDLDFLNEKFKRNLEKLRAKASSLDEEYKHDNKNLAKILKTISEIQADLHHAKIFYDLFVEQIEALDHEEQSKYNISGFQSLQNWITQIRKAIEEDVLVAFQHEENKRRYRNIASSCVETIHSLLDNLTSSEIVVNKNQLIKIENLCIDTEKSVMKLQQDLKILSEISEEMENYRDRPDYGEFSTEYLSHCVDLIQELLSRVRNDTGISRDKLTFFMQVRDWMESQISTIMNWIRSTEHAISAVEKIASPDDILLTRRELQHFLQESSFVQQIMGDIARKLAQVSDEACEEKLLNVRDGWDVLFPKLKRTIQTVDDLEESFTKRRTFITQIEMDNMRLCTFIDILKTKNIDRPSNFIGRVTVNLLESYLGDCSVLNTYIQQLPDLAKVQFNPLESHNFLEPIDREIEHLCQDYRQNRTRFETLLSETTHKLESHLKAERQLHELHSDYQRLTQPLLTTIVGVENKYDPSAIEDMQAIAQSNILHELSPSYEAVKKIHNNCSSKVIESVPFDILQSKWKRLCRVARSSDMRAGISIDHQKRQQELKRLILEMARQVSMWVDDALNTLQMTSSIPVNSAQHVHQAQSILQEIRLLHEEEEGTQYGKIIQILNLHTELVLFGSGSGENSDSDIENIIKNIERKWLLWLRDSKTIMDKLNQLIEELMKSDYQKKNFHNMSVGIVEWIDLVTKELAQISQQSIQDATQLHIQMHHLGHWMRQKPSKLEIIAELQDVCDTMRVPDNELILNMKEIKARWAHLERVAAEKESLLTELSEKFDYIRTEDTQILHTQEEMIRWISFERDHLIHALKQDSSLVIQEALDQTRSRVKAEASPLLEYLRKQRKFAHKQLLESHWSTFMFLFNRTKKRCDELQDKEQKRKVKLETFQSKLEVHFDSLSQLLEAVERIVQYSGKAAVQEMESALNDMIEVYASMEHIVGDFVNLLSTVDKDDDVLVDHQLTKSFETFCIECFTRFEELFQQYSADYEAKMKSEGISSAYFSLYNALTEWNDQQKSMYEEQQSHQRQDSDRGHTEQLTQIASNYQFFKDYFSQRQQITLMYRQMSDIWATLSSMGIVLEMELPTPVDLKNLIESLDETMGNALSRADDLISQFDYVLSLRQQFIETACNLSEFSQDALQQLTEYPVISLQSFHHVREQVETYKKRDRNTVTVLSFLEELIQTILDECILLPKDWDPQLRDIVSTLRGTRQMFETALTSKESFLLKCEPLLTEMASANGLIRDMRSALLSYISQIKPHLEEFIENQSLSRAERLNQLGKFVGAHNAKSKYLSKLLSVCSKVKHLNWSSPDDDSSLASVWNEVYSTWTDITSKLDECVQNASIVGEGIPPMTKTSDVQLFLEILFLNIWIADSCLDLHSLLDHDLRREDISDILFDINIFSREMEENQVVLKRVLGVDPESVEIQNLMGAWSQLQELFSRAIEKLTDHVMVKFHFEHDRERVLSIHKSLAEFIANETHLSNPSLLNQEYRFYYELMVPEHYENNVTLRNLFTSREIRALQEDFENMKKPFLQYMSTEDNHALEIEKIRTLITGILKNLFQYLVLFSQRDLHLEEDLEEITKQVQQCEKSCDNISSNALSTLTHFVETLDEEYQSIHVALLDFIQNLVRMTSEHVTFILSEVKILFNERASLEHIKKKYHQKAASILDRLTVFEDLIEKYVDEEDISGAINIISRSVNPNSIFQPSSTIAARYIEKLRMSPDDMQKQFDILYTLKYEVESLGVIFSDLCLIHADKMLAERIPVNFSLTDDSNETLETISRRWNTVVNSVNTQIDNMPITDLEKSSRFLEVDFQELTRWFDDAIQFITTCEEGTNNDQFHDLQWTLLGTKMFKVRRDNMEDRYNRYISTLIPGENSEDRLNTLNDKKDLLEERMASLPNEKDIQSKMDMALSFEHQQLDYAQHIEEINKWQDEFDHDLSQFSDVVNSIRASATSMDELESKLSAIEKCKILLPIYKERFEDTRSLVDQVEVNFMSIKEHSYFDELFFTELEPDTVVEHRADQGQQLKHLTETVQLIEKEMIDKMKQGMDFISKYNTLAKWGEQSLALFYNNITLDSAKMIDHARLRGREWSIEYHENKQELYDDVIQTMSVQNSTFVFYIAYCIKYFSVLSVEDFKKLWNKMLVSQKNRENQLEKLREHQEEVDQKYHLPAEIVDPIYSTFMHFAHHNTKSSSIGMLHEYLMGRFLITVGINLLDDFERTKGVEHALSYSESGDAKNLTFDEMMRYLSENHLNTAFKASDLIIMFRRIERARGTLTWEKLVSVIGAALNQEQIQLLYTLIRFSGTGIDFERLAEDMFG